MSPLNKKLLRDLAAQWTQVIAIIIVIALGVVMFAGPLLAQRDLRDSVNDIRERTNYEDFSAEVESAPAESVQEVSGISNVEAVEGRVSGDVLGKVDDALLTLRIISVPEAGRPAVNDVIVESGRYLEPGQTAACLAEHHLTGEFAVEPGDTLTIIRDGEEVPLEVVGSVVSPEYLRLVRSNAEYVTDPSTFGVIFLPYNEASGLLGVQGDVNDFVVRVRDENRLDETMEDTGAVLEPYNVVSLTTGADEPGAVTLGFEIDTMGKLAVFFAILLLGVAALALYITMTQIVYSQQQQIGVMRAVGYGRTNVTVHYLGYGLVLGVVGGVVGIVFGYLLSALFVRVYSGIFDLPFIETSLYIWIALAGIVAAVFVSVAGAVIPARHAVTMKPAEAMRVEAGLALGLPGKHRAPSIGERLGFPAWLRVSLRNLLRNRRRTILTLLGVIGTICLLVTATGGKDSLDNAVDKYLNGVLRWDVAAVWEAPVEEDMLRNIEGIEGVSVVEPMITAPARLLAEDTSVDLQVQAYAGDTELHGEYPTEGSNARPGPGEIVLNRSIKKKVPVELGETVTLSTSAGSLDFTVAGFVSEPFGGVCYVSLPYIQGLVEGVTGVPNPVNAVVMKVRPGFEDDVAKNLESFPGVSQVITKSRILTVFEDLIGAIKTLFLIFYVMAFAMGFAVLFSMVTVNVFERRREIATMRTLGAGRGRIFSFLTIETLTVVLAALVPGILLGRLLQWWVIEKLIASERMSPDVVISGATLALIVGASVVVMVLSELPAIRKLWRMDLARVTKERVD